MTEQTNNQLVAFIQRIERLAEEQEAIKADIGEVYAELKATGYDPKIVRKIVRIRKMDPDKRREEEILMETYMSALQMEMEF